MEAARRIEPLLVEETPLLPPGPRGPALFHFVRSGLRPTVFLEACARRFGDPFSLRIPGRPTLVFFSHPDAIREIFHADPGRLRAGEGNALLGPLLGQHSLLLLDGERHLQERRLMLPPFHGARMQAYGEVMRAMADRVIDGWPVGRPFPIHPEMQRITLDVILRTVFGLDEGEVLEGVRGAISRLIRFAAGPAALLLFLPFLQYDLGPLSPGGRFARYASEVDALLFAEIARRRAAGVDGREDILSMLIAARDEQGRGMTDQELRDEMLTLLLAGHETTATALAWAVHHLLSHPPELAHVRAEMRAAAGTGDVPPEVASRLPYLDAVVKETLRLTPVVQNVGRMLAAPTRIGGHLLPAGVIAAPAIYLTHHRPDVWAAPERFWPERFLDLRPSPYAFLPFGGGPRRCIGAAFATYETKVVLARLLTRVSLRAAADRPVRVVRRNITLAPSGGVRVVVDAHPR
jgi:cytochrome P450